MLAFSLCTCGICHRLVKAPESCFKSSSFFLLTWPPRRLAKAPTACSS